jgi:hypothetical protein
MLTDFEKPKRKRRDSVCHTDRAGAERRIYRNKERTDLSTS